MNRNIISFTRSDVDLANGQRNFSEAVQIVRWVPHAVSKSLLPQLVTSSIINVVQLFGSEWLITDLPPMRQPTNNTRNSNENREKIKWESYTKYKNRAKTCQNLSFLTHRPENKTTGKSKIKEPEFWFGIKHITSCQRNKKKSAKNRVKKENSHQKSGFGASLRLMKYSSFIAASCNAMAVSRSSSLPVLRQQRISTDSLSVRKW